MIENLKVLMLDNYGPYKKGNIHKVEGNGRDWYTFSGRSGVYVPKGVTTTNLRHRILRSERNHDDE